MDKSITDSISKFIEENPGYRANITNFMKYIQEEKKLSLTDTVLGGIDTDDIISSIDYCIANCGFNSKSIASKYSVAISQLFTTLIVNKDIKNKDFYEELRASDIEPKSYYTQINEYITQNSLLIEVSAKDTVTDDEVEMLISLTNEEFISRENHSTAKGFEKLSALLGIKMMLLFGLKYNVLRRIKRKDIDAASNVICINGFKIRLPIILCGQLEYLISLHAEINPTYLFVDFDGKQWGRDTPSSKIPSVMYKYLRKTDTTGLTKYGISNLIKSGVSDSVIKKLTSANDTIIKDCIKSSVESEPIFWEKYINTKLCLIDVYYRI